MIAYFKKRNMTLPSNEKILKSSFKDYIFKVDL